MQLSKRVLAVIAGGALSIGSSAPAFASHSYCSYWCAFDRGYDRGYDRGKSSGYSSGYRDGESSGYKSGYSAGDSAGYDRGYGEGYDAGDSAGYDRGYGEGYNAGYEVGFEEGREYEHELLMAEGSAPPLATVPDLSAGMLAPTFDVGTDSVSKGTVSYSNSIGSADSFSVGALTNIGATASASSTPDYNVTSSATFGIGTSTINQVIGTKKDIPSNLVPISGSFSKAYTPDTIDNNVKVKGIGTDSTILANSDTTFSSDIEKIKRIKIGGELVNSGAGSANGSAGGSVGTTTSASANSSQFVSSFAQAY